jgi:hypothetical protein
MQPRRGNVNPSAFLGLFHGVRIGMLLAGKTAMTHVLYRALTMIGLCFSLSAMSCAEEGLGTRGTGGAMTGTGGAITGTGGTIAGTGGAIAGTGGMIAGTGGVVAGTGGAIAGTGGAIAGTGGAIAGTGGTITGTGGAGGNRGSGGSSGATGGATTTPDAGPQGCVANGRTYAIGETFMVDCNTCTCAVSGIACTKMACVYDARPDQPAGPDGGDVCALSANLTFGHDGGNAIYRDSNRLTASTFTITRDYSSRAGRDGATTATCSPSLPACGAPDVVSVATINTDLADPEVQGLWSLPQDPVPLFGTDSRPADGTVYSIALDDGRKVLVGGQCASPVMSSCRYIPAGLVRLTQDLQRLATAMSAAPVCKGL